MTRLVPSTPDSLVQIAYRRIRDDLVHCRVMPGEDLYESQLAMALGMSKTPVREALQRLVHEGLVSVSSRRSYRAAAVTVADVQEIFELRLLLEPVAAARVAARATDAEISELQQLADRDHGRRTEGTHPPARGDFHAALARACGNRRLGRVLEGLLEETARLFNLLDLSEHGHLPAHAHSELMDAIAARDETAARSLRVDQLNLSREAIVQVVASTANSGPPFDVTRTPGDAVARR